MKRRQFIQTMVLGALTCLVGATSQARAQDFSLDRPGHSLVGQWRTSAALDGRVAAVEVAFHADGSMRMTLSVDDRLMDTKEGRYHYADGYLTMSVTGHVTSRERLRFVNANQFVIQEGGLQVRYDRAGPAPLVSVDRVAGTWLTVQEHRGGETRWTFTPVGGGQYRAQEAGPYSAAGLATLTGNELRITWTEGGWSGVIVVRLDESGRTARGFNHVRTDGRNSALTMRKL